MPHDNTPSSPHVSLLIDAFRGCRPTLFAYARRHVACDADADDVVHAGLSAAWKKRGRFDPSRGSPIAWLTRFVGYAILDARKRAALREYVDIASVEHPELVVVPVDVARLGLRSALARALASLSDSDRALVIDRVVDERPWEELVTERGRSRQSLMRALEAALDALRRAAIREGITPDVVFADVEPRSI